MVEDDINSLGDDAAFAQMLRATMAEVTRQFAYPVSIDETLGAITAAAVSLIDGATSADVLLIDQSDEYRSAGATSPLALELSRVQQRFHQGPCVDAAVGETMVLCQDLRHDSRWPDYAAKALAAGAVGVLSFQLYTHHSHPACRAALNLFSCSASAFGPEDQAAAAMLATHGALAFVAQDREAQFQSALASRDGIGQAKGMLMERYELDAVRAFDLMRKLSQDTNTPIVAIAARIVTAGPDRNGPARSAGS